MNFFDPLQNSIISSLSKFGSMDDILILSIYSNSSISRSNWIKDSPLCKPKSPIFTPVITISFTIFVFAIRSAVKVSPDFMNQIRTYVLNGKIEGAQQHCMNENVPVARLILKGISRIGRPLEDINTSIENAGKLEVYKLRHVRFIAIFVLGDFFFEFEKRIHDQRKIKELSVNEICKIWIDVQKQSLGPSIKFNDDYKYFWSYIPHFIHSPFYVYAYAFGDCLVNSLFNVYESKLPKFEDKYITLLESGGSNTYDKLLKPFGLNPKKKDFWQKGVNVIESLIDLSLIHI